VKSRFRTKAPRTFDLAVVQQVVGEPSHHAVVFVWVVKAQGQILSTISINSTFDAVLNEYRDAETAVVSRGVDKAQSTS